LFFEKIFSLFPNIDLKECTLEANPDDINSYFLKELKTTPVDRLSIGVQSFRDEDLKFMNRAHNASQADYAIKEAQDAGFSNLTIDLIYGVPEMNDNAWQQNLHKLSSYQIPHFSSYTLTVEEGTALHHSIKKQKTKAVDEEQSAKQFEMLIDFAQTNGYEQYEISNFAFPNHYAIHNTNYWKSEKYLGIGPSAHSFDGVSRRWNIANNALYVQLINKKEKHFEEETLSSAQQLNEYIMTSLRTQWGCDLENIIQKFGKEISEKIKTEATIFVQKDWLIIKDEKLLLTKKGKLFADRIASELFQ
jgi:oxygen-independent coproporphyrinogen-3 oxidase